MQNYDKALHFGVGIALAAVAGLLGLVWSIPAAAAVAVGKEVYDLNHRDKHTPGLDGRHHDRRWCHRLRRAAAGSVNMN